jgi:hypothetical protein
LNLQGEFSFHEFFFNFIATELLPRGGGGQANFCTSRYFLVLLRTSSFFSALLVLLLSSPYFVLLVPLRTSSYFCTSDVQKSAFSPLTLVQINLLFSLDLCFSSYNLITKILHIQLYFENLFCILIYNFWQNS